MRLQAGTHPDQERPRRSVGVQDPSDFKNALDHQSRPGPAASDQLDGLKLLLDVEAEARRANKPSELYLLIANETRKLTGARQIFVFRHSERLKMVSVSGMPKLEQSAPVIQEITRFLNQSGQIDLAPADITATPLHKNDYPFAHFLWVPMLDRSKVLLGGFLLACEREWTEADEAVAVRLSETYGHALAALHSQGRRRSLGTLLSGKRSKLMLAAAVAGLLAMAFPVPMTVLAPLEVIAEKPFIVASPIQGVIEEIIVSPGDKVTKGDPLVRMSGTELRNKLDVAKREVEVARARLKKASQMAFGAENDRNELRLSMADLNLKQAELKFAEDMFQRSVIRAERSGVAVLSDKLALTGKPVVTGERIMQIADPKQVELRINLPISDAIVLEPNARVKVYLDSDPVSSREARILYGDYQALPTNGDQMAFRVIAKLVDETAQSPRLGVRGTAQIYGPQTMLGFYLFRRPLSALRQWVGL